MSTQEGGEDSVAQTEVSSITFGIGSDILSLPAWHTPAVLQGSGSPCGPAAELPAPWRLLCLPQGNSGGLRWQCLSS